jgi:Ca2+/H+ antiporter, TMEM165/GDT1 family
VVVVVDFVVAIVPVFVASVVECIEAWTVVVAVGLTRGWRAPLIGVVAAMALIGGLVAIFGVTLVNRIDEHVFEVVIGTMLVLFGLRWMRKAILRYLGVIALHDEDVAYRKTVDELGREVWQRDRFDWAGFSIAGKTMLLEGLEITFLVITLGASGDASYPVAITGAAAAFVMVGVVGFAVRGPLSKVPENTLKAFVSVMLCTFGVYWIAGGFGVDWAGGAYALLYLFGFWLLFMTATVRSLRPSLAAVASREAVA